MAAPTGRFPARSRLLKSVDFKRVFEEPCRVSNDYLTLLAAPNGRDYPRLGLAISKKHVKTAVGRNRIKRQVRESFRHHQDELGGLDVVVLAKAGAARAPLERIRFLLDGAWRKLNQRCERS